MVKEPEITNEQIIAAITEGVRQAYAPMVPDRDEIIQAIARGIDMAFPLIPHDHLIGAIAEGTEEAIGKGQRGDVLGAIALGTERAMES